MSQIYYDDCSELQLVGVNSGLGIAKISLKNLHPFQSYVDDLHCFM